MVVGFTCSAFDLLHAGHVLMLKEAKDHCDWLIAALQTDPTVDRPQKNKPIQSVTERYIQLEAVKYVDEILVYETEEDLMTLLANTGINIRFIGEDYLGKEFTGKKFCEDNGITIHYNGRKHNYSTTGLRKRVAEKA